MKMIYGGTPINSLKVKHYEMDTNSADVQPSDMQAGVTAFARGRKITGTGKAFEFAYYGNFETNDFMIIPAKINVIHISSSAYPMQNTITLDVMKNLDFATQQVVANVVIDGTTYPIKVASTETEINIECDQTIKLQIFFGKDNYAL